MQNAACASACQDRAQQVLSLSDALVAVHAKNHSNDVKVMRFSEHRMGSTGVLTHAAVAWARFLETLPGPTVRQQCQRAIVVLMAKTWIDNFVRESPRWPASRMLATLQADEAAVQTVEIVETGEFPAELANFLAVLDVLRQLLRLQAAEWEDLARAEAQLQQLLGEDTGRALAQAIWQALAH